MKIFCKHSLVAITALTMTACSPERTADHQVTPTEVPTNGVVDVAVDEVKVQTKSQPSTADTMASNVEVLPVSEIKWEQLNPARGDKSPQAGTLWGNRKASDTPATEYHHDCPICSLGGRTGEVPTGFLVKFVDGFSSPPHIHNVTYRAAVLDGLVHNDDPDAAPMWMPVGSFWTQPKGEVHITSAKGDVNIALVEIDTSPYLVLPPEQAFDSGERPVNVDASNVVWVTPPGMQPSPNGIKMSYLWGQPETDGQDSGTFIKLPSQFSGHIASSAETFRAVVITGSLKYQRDDVQTLDPGSYFGSQGTAAHQVMNSSAEESIIYIRSSGSYEYRHTLTAISQPYDER